MLLCVDVDNIAGGVGEVSRSSDVTTNFGVSTLSVAVGEFEVSCKVKVAAFDTREVIVWACVVADGGVSLLVCNM